MMNRKVFKPMFLSFLFAAAIVFSTQLFAA
ncbi:MAG: hypothetical protein JWQ30_2520, partial [Sediminibacterium sp.]|nr:hypothetical protein [Sediminibacterium sp.]